MRCIITSFAVTAALVATLASSSARADELSPSLWDPAWSRVTPLEVGVSAGVAGGALLTAALVHAGPPKWTSGILFDDAGRDALHATGSGRQRASDVSDALEITLLAAPLVSAGATWGLRHDGPSALQLVLIDAQAYALTEATVDLMKVLIRRERPDAAADHCEDRLGEPDCAARAKKSAFPSNHAASSFVAASLLCTEHLHLGIAGAPWDATVCASSLVAAATVSTLRVVADRHYLTDIVAGSVIGGLYGWLMPTILHFHGGRSAAAASAGTPRLVSVRPLITPNGASLGVAFTF